MKPTPEEKARLGALLRRVDKARDFPANTCPASRHLHGIAQMLAAGREPPMLRDEPFHCAETMLAVLASLWELRSASPEYAKELRDEIALLDATPEAPECGSPTKP